MLHVHVGSLPPRTYLDYRIKSYPTFRTRRLQARRFKLESSGLESRSNHTVNPRIFWLREFGHRARIFWFGQSRIFWFGESRIFWIGIWVSNLLVWKVLHESVPARIFWWNMRNHQTSAQNCSESGVGSPLQIPFPQQTCIAVVA